MNESRKLVKNTVIVSIGKMGTQVVNFLLLPLYTAKLPADAYGNFDYVTTIASFLVPLITMLMEEAMFRFLIDCNKDEERKFVISQTFLFCAISCIVSSIIIILLSYIFQSQLGGAILVYSISWLLIALANSLSRGIGNIGLYSFSNFLVSACIIILNLILIIFFKQDFLALMISSCVANIGVALFVLWKLSAFKYIKITLYKSDLMKKMLSYSIPLVPNTISWSIINVSDRLVIMSFLGATANGIYSIAYKFPNLINMFTGFFNIAWREISAEMVRDGNTEEFEKIHKTIKNVLFSITILLVSSIRYIYPFFISGQYADSIVYVPILAIAIYYTSLATYYGGVFTAYKSTKILGITSTISAIINLALDIILFRWLGVYAAAISTLISSFFLYFYRKIKMQLYINEDKKSNKIDITILIYYYIICIIFYRFKNCIIQEIAFIINVCVSIMINKTNIIKVGSDIITYLKRRVMR